MNRTEELSAKLDKTKLCMLVQDVAHHLGYSGLVCICEVSPHATIRETPEEVWRFINEAVYEKLGRTPTSNDEVPSVDSA